MLKRIIVMSVLGLVFSANALHNRKFGCNRKKDILEDVFYDHKKGSITASLLQEEPYDGSPVTTTVVKKIAENTFLTSSYKQSDVTSIRTLLPATTVVKRLKQKIDLFEKTLEK